MKKKMMSDLKAGQISRFLLPSSKLRTFFSGDLSIEQKIHRFLLKTFGTYTVTAGNIFSYFQNGDQTFYGEHKEYKVAAIDKQGVLKIFLSEISMELEEETVFLETGSETTLIYPISTLVPKFQTQ